MSLDRLVSPAARNQLVLEVGDAGEEPNPFQLAAIKVWTVAHPLQRRSDDFLFALVIKPGKLGSRFLGSQLPQEPADRVGAVDRNDGHAFGLEVASRSPGGQRQGELVGHPLNQDDRAHSGILPSSMLDGEDPRIGGASFRMSWVELMPPQARHTVFGTPNAGSGLSSLNRGGAQVWTREPTFVGLPGSPRTRTRLEMEGDVLTCLSLDI